jgi:UDP-glucose 4-epimerase
MSKHVIVTGGAGYIGSHVCLKLKEAGYKPVAFDNLYNGQKSAVKWGPFRDGDVRNYESIKSAISKYEPVAVVHMAGRIEVGDSVRNPANYYHTNVGGTANVLKACVMNNVPMVFSSTCATFGFPMAVLDETHRQQPLNPYGDSKMLAERMMLGTMENSKWQGIILRYFNAAGADPEGRIGEDHTPETHLIPLLLQAAIDGTPFDVYGTNWRTDDGTCVRDYVHVMDLADAHVAAVKKLEGATDVLEFVDYNLGTGKGYSVFEVIATVERITGKEINWVAADRRPGDADALVADPSRARRGLHWEAQYDLDDMVKHAYAWLTSKS